MPRWIGRSTVRAILHDLDPIRNLEDAHHGLLCPQEAIDAPPHHSGGFSRIYRLHADARTLH